MKNTMMKEKELNVKVGDRVAVEGNRGTVTGVWTDGETTEIKVHFDENEDISTWGQYQDKWYGLYTVL